MKQTIGSEIKLWWHCLWKLHRRLEYAEGVCLKLFGLFFAQKVHIACGDCNYGADLHTESAKAQMKGWSNQ